MIGLPVTGSVCWLRYFISASDWVRFVRDVRELLIAPVILGLLA
jgi:hypothetical protein